MGNCFAQSKKSTAEIAPYDSIRRFKPVPVVPTVRLYGSASSTLAAYIRFALLHKNLPLQFVPTDKPPCDGEPLLLEIGSETVSGYRETLLQFIEDKFPHPPLGFKMVDTTPLMVQVTWLQHRSITWHLERMVRWAEDLSTRGGRRTVDPAVGSPRMELRKFGKNYSQLLELMVEHAQMEERVVFPVLEMADRGTLHGLKILIKNFIFLAAFNLASSIACLVYLLINEYFLQVKAFNCCMKSKHDFIQHKSISIV